MGTPAARSSVEWPVGWTPRFTIFVDVEEEFDWGKPLSREARVTTAVSALLPFATAMAARGVGVTYLVDHPVATCARSIEILRRIVKLPGAEIGTQLHAWVNPPFDEPVTQFHSFAGNLPETLEAAKIDVLTEAITAAVGVRPRAFRSGRYGIGPNTARLLSERSYWLDTSVRPGFDYRVAGGPDFRREDNRAYRLTDALVELPLTTVYTGWWRRAARPLRTLIDRAPKAEGALSRLGLLSRVPLSPEGVTANEAVRAIERAVADGEPVLNFSFHSPSLVPGHTPYVRTQADLVAFHSWWDTILDRLDALNVRPASLADLLAAACPPPPASATQTGGVGL